MLLAGSSATHGQPVSDAEKALAREVQTQGWIVYGARTASGDWDLFVMRPDGSRVRNLTCTPEYNEGLPRFAADGQRLLYRRLPRAERFDNTGNKEEDGDPKNSGAPMGLMRLADAPIVGGDSASLRAAYPRAKAGPVLRLPSGWEPHWALVELRFDP